MSALWATLPNRRALGLVALGAAALVLAATSVALVPETRQAVVLRMGAPVRVVNPFSAGDSVGGGGLALHWPLAETLVMAERRLMPLVLVREPVRGSDQHQALLDVEARWRVIDPVRMVRAAGSQAGAEAQLKGLLPGLLRAEIGQVPLGEVLAGDGGAAMARLRVALDARARDYGVQVVDVRIAAAALPEAAREAAFAAMQAERETLALEVQSEGARAAQQATAEGEAHAAAIYAASVGKDPEFYDFYRAMKSYDAVLANPDNKGASTIVLPADSEYLRQFKGK